MCSTDTNASFTWTTEKMNQCGQKLEDVVKCMVDGRDHRGCCFQRRVPPFCREMCRGIVDSTHAASLVCQQFLPEIRSCFLDGYGAHISAFSFLLLCFEWFTFYLFENMSSILNLSKWKNSFKPLGIF